MQHAILAQNLTIIRSGQKILNALDFSVAAGEITGLIGPSGSGKTTLMRAIVGVQKVNEGALTVFGLAAGDRALRRRIGYVSQSPAVYEDLTVAQNLAYFAAVIGVDRQAAAEVIRQVDLKKQSDQLVGSLSGGQRARVSLAVALLGDADLLVLDEPTVGLDPLLRQSLWGLFRELAQAGKTLLISSHVMDEAEQCPSLLLLRDGEVLAAGRREALLRQTHTADVKAAFLALIKEGGDA